MLNIKVLVSTNNDLRALRVPAFAGRLRAELGASRVRDKKSFVWVTEC